MRAFCVFSACAFELLRGPPPASRATDPTRTYTAGVSQVLSRRSWSPSTSSAQFTGQGYAATAGTGGAATMLAFGLGLAFAGLARPRAAAPLMVGNSEGALRRKNKRIRQNERDRMRNKSRKSELKTATRKTLSAISDGDLPVAQVLFRNFQKLIDRHATKGLLHKNKAARVKSRIHRKLKSLEPPYEVAVEPAPQTDTPVLG